MNEFNFEWYDNRAFNVSEKTISTIEQLIILLAKRILSHSNLFKNGKNFTLDKYIGSREVAKIFEQFHNAAMAAFSKSFNEVFALSNAKNEKLYKYYGVKSDITPERNSKAIEAFTNSKRSGVTLSERIWNITDETKKVIENKISENLLNGKPAREWSKDLRTELLDKSAPKYNLDRVAITETNMAYREADFTRWQGLDFVIGVEIMLSKNPNHCPLCARLVGKYPNDFKFIGWHPRCRCRTIPILQNLDGPQIKPTTKYTDEYKEWFKAELKKESQGKQTAFIFRENRKVPK